MTRMIREFVDVPNHASLNDLIEELCAVRDALPAGTDAEVRMRGDDIFGRKLSISYSRPQTAAEKASDDRCRESYLERRRQILNVESLFGEERGTISQDLEQAA
jgi:hypothetical protein